MDKLTDRCEDNSCVCDDSTPAGVFTGRFRGSSGVPGYSRCPLGGSRHHQLWSCWMYHEQEAISVHTLVRLHPLDGECDPQGDVQRAQYEPILLRSSENPENLLLLFTFCPLCCSIWLRGSKGFERHRWQPVLSGLPWQLQQQSQMPVDHPGPPGKTGLSTISQFLTGGERALLE